MSIYGSFHESSLANNDNFLNEEDCQILSVEEANQLTHDLLKIMIDLNESEEINFDSLCEACIEEGANQDMTNAVMKHLKEIKANIKEAKGKVKEQDYKAAKNNLSTARSELKKMESSIKSKNSDITSSLIGIVAGGLLTVAQIMCPLLLNCVGKKILINSAFKTTDAGLNMFSSMLSGVGEDSINDAAKTLIKQGVKTSIAGVVSFISKVILVIKTTVVVAKDFEQLMRDIKDEKTSTENSLNLYRNKLLQLCNKLDGEIQKVENIIEKRSKL